MPNFELYERTSRRRRLDPSVTVMRNGSLSFSRSAVEMLGNPEAVVLLCDRDEKLIGFREAARSTRNARVVRSYKDMSHIVGASALCRYMEADTSESRRYPLAEIDGVACIDLKQPGMVVTSNRARTGRS